MMNMRVGAAIAASLVTSVAVAQSPLTTTFVSNNQFAGNMFDLRATNPNGLMVTSFDINLATSTVPATIEIWWRTGTFVGNHTSSAGWTLLGTDTVVSNGQDIPTPVNIGGLNLPFNQTIGMFVFVSDWTANPPPNGAPALRYTNINPALPMYSNADLEFTGGIGRGNSVAGDPFASSVFGTPGSTTSGRIWNGNVHYVEIPAPGAAALLGLGGLVAIRRRR